MKRKKLFHLLLLFVAVVLIVLLTRIQAPFTPAIDISSKRIEQSVIQMASHPHRAGTLENQRVGNFLIRSLKEAGWNVTVETQSVQLPQFSEGTLELTVPESENLDTREKVLEQDPYSKVASEEVPFFAYSPDGSVEGDVVFANFGAREDYSALKDSGIDLRGKIALVRAQGICRSMKAEIAQEEGLAGMLLYPELKDQGFAKPPYPVGPHLNPWVAQRGSMLKYYEYPGDPYSEAGNKNALPLVPALPITPSVAETLLRNMEGRAVPASWKGWMKVPYRTGPGPARVKLSVSSKLESREIHNIFASLPGTSPRLSSIMAATHYDAWVFGASDPGSGSAVVLEAARALGKLHDAGWKPDRNITFVFWDGEEYGMLGSSKWVQSHYSDVRERLALFTYIDSVRGPYFSAYLTPGLQSLMDETLSKVKDPSGRSISELRGEFDFPGFSSDTIPFAFAGVPVAQLNYGLHYPVYHSVYDNLNWMRQFGDPGFQYSAVLARVLSHFLYQLSQHPVFPYNFEEVGLAVGNVILKMEMEEGNNSRLHNELATLRAGVEEFQQAAARWNQTWRHRDISGEEKELLDSLLSRALYQFAPPTTDQMIPFRNLVIGPSFENECAGTLIPSLTEAAQARNLSVAIREIERLDQAFRRSASLLNEANGLLSK